MDCVEAELEEDVDFVDQRTSSYGAEHTPPEMPPKGSREEETWSRAELPDCRRATPAGAARLPELLVRWSCHLASAPVQLPEYTAGAAGLRPDGFDGGRQLRRGEAVR
ncbi:unnamed protein product [Boreogadus saida]